MFSVAPTTIVEGVTLLNLACTHLFTSGIGPPGVITLNSLLHLKDLNLLITQKSILAVSSKGQSSP
jgi:hypothetical protein